MGFGFVDQKKERREPLLRGEIRSCFSMIEPKALSQHSLTGLTE